MRKKIIAGNWKMNANPTEATALAKRLIEAGVESDYADVVFCVPAIDIPAVVGAVKGTGVAVGGQNVHFKPSGAYTGEISADMLTDAGARYVIIGHSERRQYFGETDETVNLRLAAALAGGLIPIVCVGESLGQRERGVTIELVRSQVKTAFGGVSAEDAAKTIIAYEPIWAIGTGRVATAEQAQDVCAAIRTVIGELYGSGVADSVRVQYGGSVARDNAAELFGQPDIDGGLVGGASLKEDFVNITNYKARKG
ncbi:MAG: triose-phosphate isomerase [Clostridiales bacterium]|nr:triose-phosphate isomerase [Clostridiales bacterium]